CVEMLPSGFGSFRLSPSTSQPGNSEFICSFTSMLQHQTILGASIVLYSSTPFTKQVVLLFG
uniref:Uncharacterized protein n=1 Tax=Aegilops tauschii subsp. strangulata TaxID=200361 RepID=A0A453N1J9_AEGTS